MIPSWAICLCYFSTTKHTYDYNNTTYKYTLPKWDIQKKASRSLKNKRWRSKLNIWRKSNNQMQWRTYSVVFLSNYRYRKTRSQNSLRFIGHVDGVILFWTSSLQRFLCVTWRLRRDVSPHVRLWNLESRVLESGIRLKDSGIPLTIGIQNPSFTEKYWNPVPGVRNPQGEIQNPRLSWILLHGARRTESSRASWHQGL